MRDHATLLMAWFNAMGLDGKTFGTMTALVDLNECNRAKWLSLGYAIISNYSTFFSVISSDLQEGAEVPK